MHEYETVFILDPGLDENQVNDEVQKTESWITSHGGTIQEVQRWGRKRLAYEIRRKRDGVYTLIKYESSAELVKELERRLRLNDNVMRVMTVIIGPDWEIAAAAAESEAAAAAVAAAAAGTSDEESPTTATVAAESSAGPNVLGDDAGA